MPLPQPMQLICRPLYTGSFIEPVKLKKKEVPEVLQSNEERIKQQEGVYKKFKAESDKVRVLGCSKGERLAVGGCRLVVVGCWLSVVGCRLAVVGCRLVVVGCSWRLGSGHLGLNWDYSSVTGQVAVALTFAGNHPLGRLGV